MIYGRDENGNIQEIGVRALENLPIGTIVEIDDDVEIPKDWEEVGDSGEIYSEEERRIGTWLGKPLYRKVYNLQNGLANGGNFEIENASVIETYTRIEGVLKFNDTGFVQVPYSLGSNDYSGIYIQGTKLYYKTVSYANRPLKIVLEYTKTTD